MAAGGELGLGEGLLSVLVDEEPESDEEPEDFEESDEDEDEDSPLAPVELPEPDVRLSVR